MTSEPESLVDIDNNNNNNHINSNNNIDNINNNNSNNSIDNSNGNVSVILSPPLFDKLNNIEESYVTCKVEQLNINEIQQQTQKEEEEEYSNNEQHQTDINEEKQELLNNEPSPNPILNLELSSPEQQEQQIINSNSYNISNNNNNNNIGVNFLEVLKQELINYIFLQVGALDMPSLIGVNRQCYKIGLNEKLWLYFVENDFNVDIHEIHQLIRLNGGVRSLYANLYFKRKNSVVKVSSPNPLIKYFLKPISKLPNLFSRKEFKALMYGLDGVGKTTMLYKFARGENVRTLHTNGYNVEVVEYKSCDFICWDIGFEQNSIVPVWHHYLQDTQAIIFIIDSTDRQRIRQVREEFWKLVTDKNVEKIVNNFKTNNSNNNNNNNNNNNISDSNNNNTPQNKVKVLIYSNKLDQTTPPNIPMTTLEITQHLSLFNLPSYISWYVQGCSAISEEGDGLYEGLDWLSSQFDS